MLDHDLLRSADLVVVDGNLPATTVDAVLALGVRVVIDPVSVAKAQRISPLLSGSRPVYAITPTRTSSPPSAPSTELHDRGVEVVWVRRGAAGSLLSTADGEVELEAPAVTPVDVTGAGDAMLAAFCHRLMEGATLADAAAYGHEAAALTVASPHTVVPDLRDEDGPVTA